MAPSQSLFFVFLIIPPFLTSTASADNLLSLVFKGCADQNFQDYNGVYRQTLQNLFETLISQSSSTKFYKTSTAESSPSSFNGLFQCRGDLSNADCNRCVSKIPSLAQKLCGQAIAARVELTGCYLMYQISGFKQISGTELLYKTCVTNRASGSGFEERLNSALGEITKGVVSNGFYAGGYESVYVLGQCQGDLSGGDCVNCVRNAIDRINSECGSSISAQIYLQACYISYTYYPNGVPTRQQSVSGSGAGSTTEKTVALVLGGILFVGLVMSCLLFAKSALEKKNQSYKFSG